MLDLFLELKRKILSQVKTGCCPKNIFRQAKRDLGSNPKSVVTKVGSSVLTSGGDDLKKKVFRDLTQCVSMLKEGVYEIVIVSSGAIVARRKNLGCLDKPRSIPQKQASAAISQAHLM